MFSGLAPPVLGFLVNNPLYLCLADDNYALRMQYAVSAARRDGPADPETLPDRARPGPLPRQVHATSLRKLTRYGTFLVPPPHNPARKCGSNPSPSDAMSANLPFGRPQV